MSEVLHAAAFIVGEYSASTWRSTWRSSAVMMPGGRSAGLSGETQNVFVQAAMKVLAAGMYQPYNQ